MIQQYEALLATLPKGSLICRKQEYFYLKYRDGDKLHDVYIGKEGPEVAALREQLQQRKHYQAMLSALYKEQKMILKLLEVSV